VPQEITCPNCGRRLQVEDAAALPWLTCPTCLTELGYPSRRRADGGRPLPSGERQVKRDWSVFDLVLWVLTALCAGGVVLVVVQGRGSKGMEGLGLLIDLMALTLFLDVLALALMGRWVFRRVTNIAVGVLVFLGLAFAIVIVFSCVCWGAVSVL
jgi:hypothetical protein